MIGRGQVLLAALLLAAAGCGGPTEINLSERPLFDNGVNVFEAQVLNGLTGALIPDAHVTVQVGHHALEGATDEGFHTVYGIPYGNFRIIVTAPGFTDFRAVKAFTSSSASARLSRGDPLVYYFNNVLMYPVGTVPGDLVISVYDGTTGSPLPDATVMATLDQVSAFVDVSDPLAPNVGILPPSQATTTNSEGKAVLASSSLIMNGSYLIDVFGALDADGVYLVPVSNRRIVTGQQVQEVVVFLSRPMLTPAALKANNEGNAIAAGLQVTFPYAVALCSQPEEHGWTNTTYAHGNSDSDGDGVVTSPAAVSPVAATLGTNDTELSLTFETENDDAGDELWVTFTGVRLKPRGASDSSCTSLSSVPLRNLSGSPYVDTEINVRERP